MQELSNTLNQYDYIAQSKIKIKTKGLRAFSTHCISEDNNISFNLEIHKKNYE